jgi:mannose-6-phosphate isomerase-like protein (cupin superfamily)
MEPKADWRFNIDSEADAEWAEGLRRIFDYRDLGIKEATNGDYIAQIIRGNGKRQEDEVQHWHLHECTFQFVYVLNGWARFEYEGEGVRTLRKGDCINQRPMVKHREIEYSDDYEVLEIVAPADFKTVIVDAPESAVADESRAEAAD